MDREKLNNAAYAETNTGNPFEQFDAWSVREAFKNGANWLMEQPLSERLTEAEKKNIINYYNPYCDEPNLYMQGVRAGLTLAFGSDLFKEK